MWCFAHGAVSRPACTEAKERGLSTDRADPTVLDDLRLRTAEQTNRRGRRRAQWTWEHTAPLSESPAESVSRMVIAWNGFETPTLQRVFR